MPLQYDPYTSEIRYEGKLVGRYDHKDGTARVSLNLTYECALEEWIVPLSWFDHGLSYLAKHKPQKPTVALTIETGEAAIEQEFDVLRMLTEKIVKRSGYIWVFHKTDVDQWPSALHAHDYEKNLKLDALTGNIYDAGTRQHCKNLSAKELGRIHEELRKSKDFGTRISDLLRN